MGWNASDTRPLTFTDCRVPEENLLGPRGAGFKQFLHILDIGRIGVAAMGVGLAQGALDEALAYAKERKAFGQPISKFQAIQAKLADMATEIEAARLLTYKAAWLKDQGRNFTLTAAQAKLKTGRLAVRAPRRPSRSTAATATSRSTRCAASTATRRSSPSARAPTRCSRWSSPARSAPDAVPRAGAAPARRSGSSASPSTPRRSACTRRARATTRRARGRTTCSSPSRSSPTATSTSPTSTAQRDLASFYPGDLRPAGGPAQRPAARADGIGFPLLIAPAYALGGAIGVELLLAALAALAFVLAAPLARRLVPEPWATGGAARRGALAARARLRRRRSRPTLAAGALSPARRCSRCACARAPAAAARVRGARCSSRAAVAGGEVRRARRRRSRSPLARWLRRRRRGLAGFVALEVVSSRSSSTSRSTTASTAGFTPYAARLTRAPTGASGAARTSRALPRLLGLWIDRDVGLLRWAPFAALPSSRSGCSWRSRRERLARALPTRSTSRSTAAFYVAICGATLVVAAFLAPTIAGPGSPAATHVLLPPGAALAAWGLRRVPRAGRVLAALTLVASVWVVAVARFDADGAVSPPHGPQPWAGIERVLPRLR